MLPKAEIAKNQDAILRWLESRGHRVDWLSTDNVRPTFKERSCTMKKRYSTADEAKTAIGPKMEIYSCGFCGGFHGATPRS